MRVVYARTPATAEPPRVFFATYVPFGMTEERWLGEAHLLEHLVANNPALQAAPKPPADAQFYAGNALTKPNHTSFVMIASPQALPYAIFSRLSRAGQIGFGRSVFANEQGRATDELIGSRTYPYTAYQVLYSFSRDWLPFRLDEIAHVRGADPQAVRRSIHEL